MLSHCRQEKAGRTCRITLEAAGDVVEDLGDVLADLAQGAAAGRAGAARLMHDLVPRKMRRQGPAAGLPLFAGIGVCASSPGVGAAGPAAFARASSSSSLSSNCSSSPGHLLRGAAELLAPQPGDLELQLLDLQRLGHQAGSGGRELFPLGGDEPV